MILFKIIFAKIWFFFCQVRKRERRNLDDFKFFLY